MRKNNFINKKSAFSLAELLVVLAMLGIIVVVVMTTSAPKMKRELEKSTLKYTYASVYKDLSLAYHNGRMLGFNPFITQEEAQEGVIITHSETEDTGAEILCFALSSYINTTNTTTIPRYVLNADGEEQEIRTNVDSGCSATKLTSELANAFPSSKVQFYSLTGLPFYITKRLGDEELYFYIVYVDMNGKDAPNSYDGNEDRNLPPDIYSFAILDTGYVVPIGPVESDSDILTARVGYYEEDGTVKYSKPMGYHQAKGVAWGYYSGKEDEDYSPTEPFSMNGIIRSKINKESAIHKPTYSYKKDQNGNYLKDANGDYIIDEETWLSGTVSNMEDNAVDVESGFHCSATNFDACFVVINEYSRY